MKTITLKIRTWGIEYLEELMGVIELQEPSKQCAYCPSTLYDLKKAVHNAYKKAGF